MKGEIFNAFEKFIVSTANRDTFEEILEGVRAGLETQEPFVGPGTYPDADFFVIVRHAVAKLGLDLSAAIQAFGVFLFPELARKVPELLERHQHPKSFLLTIHDVIHMEVKKVSPGAEPPTFTYENSAPNELVMIYQSKRGLYDLVEGLIQGCCNHFDVGVTVSRYMIKLYGVDACRFELDFEEPYHP